VFEAAKERPCVLLLDECDFIARSRMSGRDIGEASRIVNSLLQFMEDYDAPGLLVATTNVEKSLDEALFRRFDDVFEVPLPGIPEIERLLWMTLSGINVEESIEWKRIASVLVGSSAATVVKVAQDAAKGAVLTGRRVVTEANIRQALSDTKRTEPTS
jgi:ATP-dependent 26S proteasome regulatory subunit